MGTSLRDSELKNVQRANTPGPGMYGINNGQSGPKYR